MLSSTIFATLLLALAPTASGKSVSATPHDKYSSSIGVLGCKINTNRVAYWPGSVDCDKICVKLTNGHNSVHLLRIDQSGGAYDISYDAWVYLQTGKSATAKPITGGGIDVEVEEVDASECAGLIHTQGSKLPLSASNSINFLTSCLEQPDSFIAKNHVLYNICDPICTLGHDEKCKLDMATSNQPSCPHTLGLQSELTSAPVYDIEYQSGNTLKAGTDEVVDSSEVTTPPESEESDEPAPEKPATSTKAAPLSTHSHTGGVFVESGSTTVFIPEVTTTPEESAPEEPTTAAPEVTETPEAPEVPETTTETTTEAPVEPTPTSEPVLSIPEQTTLVTVTSSPVDSTSEVSVPTTESITTPSVSHSHDVPSGTPSSTPPPEGAGHSLADVPLSLLIASALLCLIAI